MPGQAAGQAISHSNIRKTERILKKTNTRKKISEIYALTGDAEIIIMSLKTLILSSDFILVNCRPVCCKNL